MKRDTQFMLYRRRDTWNIWNIYGTGNKQYVLVVHYGSAKCRLENIVVIRNTDPEIPGKRKKYQVKHKVSIRLFMTAVIYEVLLTTCKQM